MSTTSTSWILEFIDMITPNIRRTERVIDRVADSVDDLEDEFEDLKNPVGEFADEIDGAADKIDGLDLDMDELMETAEGAAEAISNIFNGLGLARFNMMSGGLAQVKKGINGLTAASLRFLATPIGIGIAALAGIALATGAFAEYNKEAAKANRITQQITMQAGDALDASRVRAQALEETFNTDFKDTLETSRALVTAFGGDYDDAFDLIENGLIRGGAANDDFMSSLREYPRLFSDAGYSMEDLQRIVNTGIDLGIYDDKFPDALKEFNLSITEQTQTTRDAMENALGKSFTDKIFTGIKSGAILPKDALVAISNEVERVGVNSQEAQQLTADLFRGAGEDAGGLLVILEGVNDALGDQERELTSLEKAIKETADANTELGEAKERALGSDGFTAFMHDFDVFITYFKAGWYDLVAYTKESWVNFYESFFRSIEQFKAVFAALPEIAGEFFTDLYEEFMEFADAMTGFGSIFEKLFKLDFSGAKDEFVAFKNDLIAEASDLGVAEDEAALKIADVYNKAGELYDTKLRSETAGAVELSKLETEKKLLKTAGGTGGTTTDTGGKGLSGSGGGSGRNITMNLDIKMYNTFSKETTNQEMNKAANDLVKRINDRLRDSVIAVG